MHLRIKIVRDNTSLKGKRMASMDSYGLFLTCEEKKEGLVSRTLAHTVNKYYAVVFFPF